MWLTLRSDYVLFSIPLENRAVKALVRAALWPGLAGHTFLHCGCPLRFSPRRDQIPPPNHKARHNFKTSNERLVMTIKRTLIRASLPIIVALCLFLSGCSLLPLGPAAEQARFQEFLHRNFVAAVTVDTVMLHMQLKNPAEFGIDKSDPFLPTVDFPAESKISEVRERIAELKTFDRARLAPEQQKDYDVLAYQAELYEPSLEFHYLKDPLLSPYREHALLPVILSIYRLSSSEDVDVYLALMKQVGTVIDAVIRFERTRSAHGEFMTDVQTAQVISECESFLSDKDNNVLLASFRERLDAIDSIDAAAREAYIAENERIFTSTVVPAYERLVTALESLTGTGKDHARQAGSEQRKAYYAYELKRSGVTRTPSDLVAIFDATLPTRLAEYRALKKTIAKDPDLDKSLAPAMSPEAMLEFWSTRMAGDFPALPDGVVVNVTPISDSLEAFAPPAFFMVPPVDDYRTNLIQFSPRLAEDHPDDFFTIMAHEGYPGHMLEKTTLMAGPLSNYRKVATFEAHTDGWAQYAELHSIGSADADASVKRLHQLGLQLNCALPFRVDLGVHYQGWGLREISDYLEANDPGWDDLPDDIAQMYLRTASTMPHEYTRYATGEYEMEQLRADYEALKGSDFNAKQFHEEFLALGPAPFFLLREWLGLPAQNDEASLQVAA